MSATPASTPQADVPTADIQPGKSTPVHLIGIGGIGMSGLARLLLNRRIPASGTDLVLGKYTKPLELAGATLFKGHNTAHLPEETGLVVVSTAIRNDNPELVEARRRGLPVWHRSELLAWLVSQYLQAIGISGTHGKTTVTGMTGEVLRALDADPSIIAGGLLPGGETNAIAGESALVVAELDESDGTLLAYHPKFAALTNLELDHAEHFPGGFGDICKLAQQFLDHLPDGATVVLNKDCAGIGSLRVPDHVTPIWVSPSGQEADYALKNVTPWQPGRYQAEVLAQGKPLGTLQLKVPGIFNLANALVALALVRAALPEASFEDITKALQQFTGMGRRFEQVGTFAPVPGQPEVLMVDDYGHHPTEVAATLEAAHALVPNGRVVLVFQPHRYTRLKALWDEFLTCFEKADLLVLPDVFPASEDPINGITSEAFAEVLRMHAKAPKEVYVFPGKTLPEVSIASKALCKPGDILLSMGAGTITSLLRQ